MISTVSGTYPDIAWDISPSVANGKLEMPKANVEVCNVQYQIEAAEFDLKDGTGGASLTKFPNGEKYWACAVKVEDGKENIQVLKAVKA